MLKLEKIKNADFQGCFYHPENTDDVGMIEIVGNDTVISIESNHDKEPIKNEMERRATPILKCSFLKLLS